MRMAADQKVGAWTGRVTVTNVTDAFTQTTRMPEICVDMQTKGSVKLTELQDCSGTSTVRELGSLELGLPRKMRENNGCRK